jgi:hypothetical protein
MLTFRNCYHSHAIIVNPSAGQLHSAAYRRQLMLLLSRRQLRGPRPEAEEPVPEDLDELAEDGGGAHLQELQEGGRHDTHLCVSEHTKEGTN